MMKTKQPTESQLKWKKIKTYCALGFLAVMLIVVLANGLTNLLRTAPPDEDTILQTMDKQLQTILEKDYPGAKVLYKSEYELIEETVDADTKMRQAQERIEMYADSDIEKSKLAMEQYDSARQEAKAQKAANKHIYMRNLRIEYTGKKFAAFQKTQEDLSTSELTSLLPIDGGILRSMEKELGQENINTK